MVIVHAHIEVKDGKTQEFLNALGKCVEGTLKEPGNDSYTPYADLSNPLKFIIVEEWQSQSALDDHFQTPHFKQLGKDLEDLLTAPLDVRVFDAVKK
jgi:quinol monooxygenase YgiN